MQDTHAESGPYAGLLAKYGMDAAAIAEAVKRAVKRKK